MTDAPIEIADSDPTWAEAFQFERQVLCDFRPEVGLRLGPHFFNTEDELRFAVDQIAELSGRAAPAGARRT